jgi:hypothetical protein
VDDLNRLVSPSLGAIVLVLTFAVVVLLGAVVVLARRLARLDRRVAGLTRGGDGTSLESTLQAHLDKVGTLTRGVDELAARSAQLERTQRRAIQRVGLVRFNPFEDTGGNQSFALALLDQHGDGLVISSLHARAGTRVYGKAIAGGKAEAALSDEEAEALKQALGSGAGPARAG